MFQTNFYRQIGFKISWLISKLFLGMFLYLHTFPPKSHQSKFPIMRIRLFFYIFDYIKNGSSVASSSALSTTPLVRHNTSPFRKSISVGTDCMRYWLAVTPYLSTSTLMIRMRSPNTLFTCSRMGCIALQGWHQVAKKSTRTSWPLFITLLNVSIIICLFP